MPDIIKAPRGTKDILLNESYKWQFVEDIIRKVTTSYGFREIRTPVFEDTDLFLRCVGDSTDIVNKEMYTFLDKSKRSLTLRPEMTACVVRALLQNGIYNDGLPIKAFYIAPCYRYEKPQAGRLREFNQFGVELFGSQSAMAEAEIITLADKFFKSLGLNNIVIEINSIGCNNCRKDYNKAILAYFKKHEQSLCGTCNDRLIKNPMRILDCKNPECKKIALRAPIILDFLCKSCKDHFKQVQEYLNFLNIEFLVNPHIVRGLDYYTRTVFEFIHKDSGSKELTICGGGRYDNLVHQMDGPDIPALGFAVGLERLLATLDSSKSVFDNVTPPQCDLYIASLGDSARAEALKLSQKIRESLFNVEYDLSDRSLKAQMKYADKLNAKFSLVIGEDELNKKHAKLKYMVTGETIDISIEESFLTEFKKAFELKSKN